MRLLDLARQQDQPPPHPAPGNPNATQLNRSAFNLAQLIDAGLTHVEEVDPAFALDSEEDHHALVQGR